MINDRNTGAAATEDIMANIGLLKADVDLLLLQLSEGRYVSIDTFANNWVHLTRLYERIQVHMYNRDLMNMLVRTDLLLAADLLSVGRMVTVMNNFLRCAERAG